MLQLEYSFWSHCLNPSASWKYCIGNKNKKRKQRKKKKKQKKEKQKKKKKKKEEEEEEEETKRHNKHYIYKLPINRPMAALC